MIHAGSVGFECVEEKHVAPSNLEDYLMSTYLSSKVPYAKYCVVKNDVSTQETHAPSSTQRVAIG